MKTRCRRLLVNWHNCSGRSIGKRKGCGPAWSIRLGADAMLTTSLGNPGQVRVSLGGGHVFVTGDVNGDQTSDFSIQLVTVTSTAI